MADKHYKYSLQDEQSKEEDRDRCELESRADALDSVHSMLMWSWGICIGHEVSLSSDRSRRLLTTKPRMYATFLSLLNRLSVFYFGGLWAKFQVTDAYCISQDDERL